MQYAHKFVATVYKNRIKYIGMEEGARLMARRLFLLSPGDRNVPLASPDEIDRPQRATTSAKMLGPFARQETTNSAETVRSRLTRA